MPQAGEQYAFTLAIDLDGTVHEPTILDNEGAESVTLSADQQGAVIGGIIRQDFSTIDGFVATYE